MENTKPALIEISQYLPCTLRPIPLQMPTQWHNTLWRTNMSNISLTYLDQNGPKSEKTFVIQNKNYVRFTLKPRPASWSSGQSF
jgi:hypothetical protein